MSNLDDLMKGFFYFAIGIVVIIVLFTLLSSLNPMLNDIMGSCSGRDCSTVSMSSVMIGLIGFVAAAVFLIKGIKLMLGSFGSQSNYYSEGYQ